MQLKNLYNVFGTHPESQWIMQPQNAISLFQFVKTYPTPIKKVLDLGTGIGCSAAIIALALKERGETDFHIDSVEQLQKCLDLANELTPEELKKHITFHKANVVTWQTELIPHQTFSTFDALPEGEYDLILNDGPSSFMEGDKFVDLLNGTITKLLLEEKLKPGTLIAWDGRIAMLAILERYFSDNFQIVAPTENRNFNVLERLDNPIAFRDERLENMKTSTYFKSYEKNTNAPSDIDIK